MIKCENNIKNIINQALKKNNLILDQEDYIESNIFVLSPKNNPISISPVVINPFMDKFDNIVNLIGSIDSGKSLLSLISCEYYLKENKDSKALYIDTYNGRNNYLFSNYDLPEDRFSYFNCLDESSGLIVLDTCIKEVDFIIIDAISINTVKSILSNNIEDTDREYKVNILKRAIKKAATLNTPPYVFIISDIWFCLPHTILDKIRLLSF